MGRSGLKKWLVVALAGVVLLGVVAALGFKVWLLEEIERQARLVGIELSACRVEPGWDQLVLRECQFITTGRELSGTLGTAEIELQNFEPRSIKLNGPEFRVVVLPALRREDLPQLMDLRRSHRLSLGLPFRISGGELLWTPQPKSDPRITLGDLEVDTETDHVSAKVEGPGGVYGTLRHDKSSTELSLKFQNSPAATLQLLLDQSSSQHGQLRAQLVKLPLVELSQLLQHSLPASLSQTIADGQVHATVPFGLDKAGIKGDLRLSLAGLSLPLPKAVAPFILREQASLSTRFRGAPNHQDFKLTKTHFAMGPMQLRGSGTFQLKDSSWPLALRLSGGLACRSLLESAVRLHLKDFPLLKMGAQALGRNVNGSIGVRLKIRGDLQTKKALEIQRAITPGCGLKFEDEAMDAWLPALEAAGNALPKLPTPDELLRDLPQLGLPQVKVPDIRLPKLELPGLLREQKELSESAQAAERAAQPNPAIPPEPSNRRQPSGTDSNAPPK